ncbi:uracil-DNA glycosylase, family 4 [Pseudanabaena sp. lw0831]|uniref:uracil-DNA glycosylase n=1 Tax=Pseudanabaena sp. lw0831 TaxID=1357935 RepID=UPI00191534EA|nr:uracil-DNA glycosylase [Pseudanabaena sp. lw0831]GBO52787.1 uracil-DNA glycosylase, family 4 [Pseudanabaena sp. lw0831]
MTDKEQMSLFDLTPSEVPLVELPHADASAAAAPTAKKTARSSKNNTPAPAVAVPVHEQFTSLDTLREAACNCQKCPLAPTRTNVVVERGDRNAKILIIGEAPGEQEDLSGLPFVGKSGQLLDKILESVGFDTNKDIYVCNTVKCRPPNNRVPTEIETTTCKPYLLEQIRLVDPKIILLTGATSLKSILGEKLGITKVRGQWYEWEGRLVMPIFHPSYLLRNQSREQGSPKWLTWQDVKAIKAKYLEIIGADSVVDDDEEF